MQVNPKKIKDYARNAPTVELLDRVTIWRSGMEADALEIMENELAQRGITKEEMRQHEIEWGGRVTRDGQGLPLECAKCPRPATGVSCDWVKLLGFLPLFPRKKGFCDTHKPG